MGPPCVCCVTFRSSVDSHGPLRRVQLVFSAVASRRRANTDASLAAGLVELERSRESLPVAFRDVAAESFAAVETQLPGLRNHADQASEPPIGLFDRYTALTAGLIDVSKVLVQTTRDAHVARDIAVRQHLLGAIETAGRQRATLAAELVGGGKYTAAEREAFAASQAAESKDLDWFAKRADPELTEAYAEHLADPAFAEVEAIGAAGPDQAGVDPSVWWDMATTRIDSLYGLVELASADIVTDAAELKAGTDKRRLLAFVGLIVALLAVPAVGWSLSRQIRRRQDAEAKLDQVVATTRDGLAVIDVRGTLLWTNPAADRFLEEDRNVFVGLANDVEPVKTKVWHSDGTTVAEVRRQATTWDGTRAYLLTLRDLTDKELARRALEDYVTGLPSRILFNDRLTKALLRLERVSGGVCVLFIDLDRFKYVNDTFGHDMGDRLLVEVSRRFTAVARTVDTVARFGGDEFTVLCEDIATDADARAIGQRFLHCLDDPIEVEGHELVMSASVGIVWESNPKAYVEGVLSAADAAMYAAKSAGRARCEFFTEDFLAESRQYLAVEGALRDAITEDRFRCITNRSSISPRAVRSVSKRSCVSPAKTVARSRLPNS